MDLEIMKIGDRNTAAYGVFKFNNFTNARNFAERGRKPMAIVLGDNQVFWVTSLAIGEVLVKLGYQLAE